MLLTILIILGLVGAAVAGTVTYLQKQSVAQREAFEALAARRGWSLNISPQSLGRPPLLRLTSRGGSGWEARTRTTPDDTSFAAQQRLTEYTGETPRWSDGYLFVGAAPIITSEDDSAQEYIDTYIIGDGMGADLGGLQRLDSPDELVILGTYPLGNRIDFRDLAKLWSVWKPHGAGGDAYPVMMVGPEGMRLHLRQGSRRAEDIEAFVDFAQSLARVIGPSV